MIINQKIVPPKIILGFANWQQCDEKILEAVQNGVNVVIWFSIDLSEKSGLPFIARGPDLDCVSKMIPRLKKVNPTMLNLISIGGWNSPHPSTNVLVEEMYETFKKWNNNLFDGFDWDIEGNDDFDSVFNNFTVACLDFMGEFSQLAKRDGLIVSMAPAESYLDPTTSAFDLALSHLNEWDPIIPNFRYHGHNCYAALLAKYGRTRIGNVEFDTFDFIMVQLYEGFSHTLFNILQKKQPPSVVLENFVHDIQKGWFIDFETIPQLRLPRQHISVPAEKLVIGLANGWADNKKFLLIHPFELEKVWKKAEFRGFGFWNIADEGQNVDGTPLFLAKELNNFMM